MSLDFHLYSILYTCSIIISLCSSQSIPALLLKEDVIGKLSAPGDVIGTFINGISKNMNGTMNIPLVVDLMQSDPDWMKPNQNKERSQKNSRISKFKMHGFKNQDRNEDISPKLMFDNSLGHKSKSEKEILNELKQSLGIMMKKPSFENRYQPAKTSWRNKPVQPKNEKLGEIDVTEPSENLNDENNDDDDSIGNEENNSLKDLQTFETPKYTTERFPSTKRRQLVNDKIKSKEKKTFSNDLHDTYDSGPTKTQKLKSQTPFQKKHHETMLSIDDILQVLEKISTDMRHEKNIYNYKEDDNSNQIDEDGEQQVLLKNLKNYFGLIDLKDKLGAEPVSQGILEEANSDSMDEEEPDTGNCKINYEGELVKLKPQLEHDDKSSANIEANELNSFYRNLTDMLMSSKSSGNMNSLMNLIRNIDNYQKSSLNSASILDSHTNLKSNADVDDSVDSLSQHSYSAARFDDKSGYTSNVEMHEELKDNKQPVQSLGESSKNDVTLEDKVRLNNDVVAAGKQSVTSGISKVSNDNSEDDRLVQSKEEAELNPTHYSESSLKNDQELNKNEISYDGRAIRESDLKILEASIRNNGDLMRNVELKENRS
ncbi:hypothetical protein LSTR_LSTR006956 [Laodelphax striatellus]|uniref:Uncharacterized protein n=1 Tax=Laodelphax striatellus TaxID=195883 RepID=A0A482WN07_LAOST|nr:hypothetical protein LSTR_LSTR006956 [Laodelphax striatellus]